MIPEYNSLCFQVKAISWKVWKRHLCSANPDHKAEAALPTGEPRCFLQSNPTCFCKLDYRAPSLMCAHKMPWVSQLGRSTAMFAYSISTLSLNLQISPKFTYSKPVYPSISPPFCCSSTPISRSLITLLVLC